MTKQEYEKFLSALPSDRRIEIDKVWQVVKKHIPDGYLEGIDSKFLNYKIDNEWYVALASHKTYLSLYLTGMYIFPELKAKLEASGKKLKKGKSCINFKEASDLPLEIIGEIVAALTPDAYLTYLEKVGGKEK